MNKIREIENIEGFIEWCNKYEYKLNNDYYQSRTNRKILDLTSCNDNRMWKLIEKFVKREGIKQILLMKYYENGKLKLHRDKGNHRMVYSLSSKDFNFIFDGKEYKCKKGCIYKFDGKMIHGLKGTVNNRWCLCWWERNKKNVEQLSLF